MSRSSKGRHHAIRRHRFVCVCRSVRQRSSGRTNVALQRHQWGRSNRGKRRFGVAVQGHAAIYGTCRLDATRRLQRPQASRWHGQRHAPRAIHPQCRLHRHPRNWNATGTAIWTAANGDQIRASVVGHGDIVVFPIVTITETHTITSGTGRFADASGTITIERVANILTGVSSGSLSGTANSATSPERRDQDGLQQSGKSSSRRGRP